VGNIFTKGKRQLYIDDDGLVRDHWGLPIPKSEAMAMAAKIMAKYPLLQPSDIRDEYNHVLRSRLRSGAEQFVVESEEEFS
jgi:hypothetical protein